MKNTKANMFIVSNSTFTIGAGFGKGKSFTVGQRVTESFYSRLTTSLKRRFDVIEPKAKGRVLYTPEEKLSALEIYLENVEVPSGIIDQDRLFAEFHALHPERSYNSFIKLLYAIRARDTHVPQQGLTTVAQDVAEALYAYDAERFPLEVKNTTKVESLIENLLTQIRLEE